MPSKPRSLSILSFWSNEKLVRTGGPKGSAPSWMFHGPKVKRYFVLPCASTNFAITHSFRKWRS